MHREMRCIRRRVRTTIPGLDGHTGTRASGEDAIGRGQLVASQRLCGNKSSRRAKLEVRVDRGPAMGLVIFRTPETVAAAKKPRCG